MARVRFAMDMTPQERDQIDEAFMDSIMDACQDRKILMRLLQQLSDGWDLHTKIHWISDDPECVRETLGFNPFEAE